MLNLGETFCTDQTNVAVETRSSLDSYWSNNIILKFLLRLNLIEKFGTMKTSTSY